MLVGPAGFRISGEFEISLKKQTYDNVELVRLRFEEDLGFGRIARGL